MIPRFFILLLSLLSFCIAQPIQLNGVAAVANGKAITVKEVRGLLAPTISLLQTKYPRGGEAAKIEFEKAQEEVLEQLIENKLILSEIEEIGGNIPDFVVDQEVKRIINEFFNGKEVEFRKSLNDSGTTMRSFKETQKEKILVQALKSERFGRDLAPPTPQELRAHYEKRKVEYRDRSKDKVTFSKIFIPSYNGQLGNTPEAQLELAEEVALKLRKGGDFSALAKEHSKDAYSDEGGAWPTTPKADLEPSFGELLMQAEIGKINGPYKDPRGFTIVKVTKKDYGPPPPFSEVSDRIAKEVESEKYKEKYNKWMEILKKKAIIERRLKPAE